MAVSKAKRFQAVRRPVVMPKMQKTVVPSMTARQSAVRRAAVVGRVQTIRRTATRTHTAVSRARVVRAANRNRARRKGY